MIDDSLHACGALYSNFVMSLNLIVGVSLRTATCCLLLIVVAACQGISTGWGGTVGFIQCALASEVVSQAAGWREFN